MKVIFLDLENLEGFQAIKMIKALKVKTSYCHNGNTSEVLEIGAGVLVVPLMYMMNTAILTGSRRVKGIQNCTFVQEKEIEKQLITRY